MSQYQAESIARYFDDFGEREWTRLVESPAAEIKLHVHTTLLRRYVTPGMRVLDIGAGAGRFTQVLADLHASVAVADISQVQLDLNRRHAAEHGFAHAVTEWRRADVCDLSMFEDATFDAVVCYGGPISYVFEHRSKALEELLRVAKPGGHVLLSVMSLWGAIHEKLPSVLATEPGKNARVVATGDLQLGAADGSRHDCHLFRSDEFRTLLMSTGCEVMALSTSNALSTVWGDRLDVIRADAARWAELLSMEVEACAEDGCLDLGTHLIAVVRR